MSSHIVEFDDLTPIKCISLCSLRIKYLKNPICSFYISFSDVFRRQQSLGIVRMRYRNPFYALHFSHNPKGRNSIIKGKVLKHSHGYVSGAQLLLFHRFGANEKSWFARGEAVKFESVRSPSNGVLKMVIKGLEFPCLVPFAVDRVEVAAASARAMRLLKESMERSLEIPAPPCDFQAKFSKFPPLEFDGSEHASKPWNWVSCGNPGENLSGGNQFPFPSWFSRLSA